MKMNLKRLIYILLMVAATNFSLAAEDIKGKLSLTTQIFLAERDGLFSSDNDSVISDLNGQRAVSRRLKPIDRQYSFVASPSTINGEQYISSFIRLKNNEDLAELERLGVIVQCKFNHGIITSLIPIHVVERVAQLSNVIRIEVASVMQTSTDTARQSTNVNGILTNSMTAVAKGVTEKYDGEGIVLGVIDSGIDYQHLAFKDKDGNSRIVGAYACFVDKNGKIIGEKETYDNNEINVLTTDNAYEDHGTHTSSIAGGSSVRITNKQVVVTDDHINATYGGMAPRADLFLAGVTNYDTYAANAMKIICDYADSHEPPQPVVINNSWGAEDLYYGNIMSDIISQYFGEGVENHICIFSSGNNAGKGNGQGGVYLQGFASPNNPLGSVLCGHYYDDTDDYYCYIGTLCSTYINSIDSNELGMNILVLNSSTGKILQTINSVQNLPEGAIDISDYYEGNLSVIKISESGKTGLFLVSDTLTTKKYHQSDSKTYLYSDYALAVQIYPIEGSSMVEAFGWRKSYFSNFPTTKGQVWIPGDDSRSVGYPATDPNVISVGSYASKKPNSWDVEEGEIAPFSSYQTKGETLPWISAPGVDVISAVNHYHLSSDYLTESEKNYGTTTYPFGKMSGTSMAAPVVTGIVALWLQAANEFGLPLTTSFVKEVMRETAIHDNFTDKGANASHFGNGKIDALAGLEYIFNFCGYCGNDDKNIKWALNPTTGVLSISGEGEMKDFALADEMNHSPNMPWYKQRDRITKVEITDGVTNISNCAFYDCKNLSTISIPASVSSIGSMAFDDCTSLTSIKLPESLTSIGDLAFSGCSAITSIDFPSAISYIGERAFCKTGLTSVEWPSSLTSVPKYTFSNCTNLSSINFPETLLSIGEGAFSGCLSITSLVLPENLMMIETGAFERCRNLNEIEAQTMLPPNITTETFAGVAEEGTLRVMDVSIVEYRHWIDDGYLPEGWLIPGVYLLTVTVGNGEHGEAYLCVDEIVNGQEEKEALYKEIKVEKNEYAYVYIYPEEGYKIHSITVNGRNVTDQLIVLQWKIKQNTHIYVEFIPKDESNDESYGLVGGEGTRGRNQEEGTSSSINDEEYVPETKDLTSMINTIASCFVEMIDNKLLGYVWGIYGCMETFLEPCEGGKLVSSQQRRMDDDMKSSLTVLRTDSGSEISFISDFQEKAAIAKKEWGGFYDMLVEYFGTDSWVQMTTMEEIKTMLDAVENMGDEALDTEFLSPYKPKNISDEELSLFIDRMNHTRALAAGIPIATRNYIHASSIDSCSIAISEAEEAAETIGYESTSEMWENEFAAYYKQLSEGSSSVCATITLQFTQKLVMTRQAFRGTLNVFNGHEESPMRDVRLNLVVSDKQGHVATSHEFQINGQSLKGFAGEVDLGSGWTLDAQATGEATILFIPTKYAAPTEPVEYSFGGTLTYIDPFTDLEVTRDLYPVTLTVKPSPNLDLTYFMQRDILGDNALTTDVVEPMVPAEFALLIHNDGYGDATDVRMTTEQPKIVENEKGLLIDFELLSSQVNGKDKVMALGGSVPADFGTIPAHSTAYAQWMLQASLLGHFTDYNVEATHVTSYGNEDLSLLNEVTIHELIHSLSLTDVDGEPLVGWLVNDVTDANDEPDMLYFSNAETTSVNMLSEEQMNMGAVDNDNVSVTLSVGVAQAGWYYGCLVDPMAGRARIAAVTRQSDGASIDPQNFWLTEYTLVDGKDPIQEYMLHFADTLSTTSETYTIAFEMLPEEMLSVTEFILPDKGDSSIYPDYVTTVGITFSKAIDPATFTIDDLKLTCRGKTIDLSGVTLSTEDSTTFTINLTGLTTEDGYYVLTVQTADITDATGYNGQAGKSVDWTQFYGGLLVLRAESQPAEGGSVSYEETAQKAALRRANENGDAQNESVLEVKVPYNSDGALMAQSAEGFGFGGWYMNDQLLSTESRYTSIFIDHTNLTAQFKQLYFDLTVDWNANRGTVTGAGTGKYSYGSNLSLVATPFEGYRFYQWEVNDEVPDDNPGSAYTHTVTGNATLSPLFLAETSSGLLLGDVKEDGNINVGDYTALVSLIVGTDGGRYLLETADHNGNKKADVGDLATEVNMIMDIGSFAANSLRHMGDNGVVQSEFDPDNRLYGPEMTVKAGDEISVPLFLANKDEVSAFQTDIVFPDGLTLLDVAVAEERTTKLDHNLLVTSSKNGGSIRLLAGSSSNVSYRGAAGAVVMLRLRADEDMEDGEYIYQLKHTVLSSADSQIFHAPDCSMPMRIGNATGILTVSPQAESAKGIYDVAGRKIANEATIDVVNRLPAGVYVVSGRKIVVR